MARPNSVILKIVGMDCAEEVAVLKREIGPLAGGEGNLSFDILNAKMTITSPGNIDLSAVSQTVAKTGMKAIPWTEYCASRSCPGEDKFWRKKGRLAMSASSGVLLTAGLICQTLQGGSIWSTLVGNAGEGTFSVIFYLGAAITGGWFIIPKAFHSARRLRPDMNLLMTVAAIGAMLLGEWFEAATVTFLFSLALLLESWSVGRARRAIGDLIDLSPSIARTICPHHGDIEEKPVEQVPVGAIVVVRPGEKIPLDGKITKGTSSINQSPITGESAPVHKKAGDEVFAGTINNEGAIEFRVTKVADDTTLARIIHMVEEAQSRRAPSEQWVEKFARYYTPAMMALALFMAVFPPLVFDGEWGRWIYEALVVLVIACPCALVISTPVSIVAGLTSAANAGVLIKGGAFLEAPAHIQAIALDKTGTLTYGQSEVQRIVPLSGHTTSELLERAAALELYSEHPLARAILRKAEQNNIKVPRAENFRALKGRGAEGSINGRLYWVGSHRFLHERGGETPEYHHKAEELENAGHSVVAIGNDNHVCGLISIADGIRNRAAEVISNLKKAGIKKVVMLTGDNNGTARAVANVTGVDEYQAELLPEDKVKAVEKLVQKYRRVAMVGDGINDAPAMAVSTLGIAMGAVGSDAAIETADIALMSDDLSKLPWLIAHSRHLLRIIKQNIWFALGIKAVFLILAITGMATLWMAIVADMGASLLVIFNSLRLLDAEPA
jgi:Cd2+/Zn2+-exporting ATPase